MATASVDVVRAWVRSLNERVDDRPLPDLVDSDFEMTESHALPGAARVSGLEELLSYMRGWDRNWSAWEWREEELEEVAPGRVLLIATLWLRGRRSGVEVERRWAYLFTIRGGRVLRQEGFADREQAMAYIASGAA